VKLGVGQRFFKQASIIMEPNTMIQVGLVPSQQLVSLLTDDEGNWRDVPEGQTVVPLVKIPKPAEGAWEPNVVWFDDRVERQWVEGTPVPAPTYTAAEWVDAQQFTGNRTTTMLYLKLQLDAAGKTSPKLAAVQAWLDQLIVAGVTAPDERRTAEAWTSSPYSFEQASQEALQVLSS
jgi:hypothetical protein